MSLHFDGASIEPIGYLPKLSLSTSQSTNSWFIQLLVDSVGQLEFEFSWQLALKEITPID